MHVPAKLVGKKYIVLLFYASVFYESQPTKIVYTKQEIMQQKKIFTFTFDYQPSAIIETMKAALHNYTIKKINEQGH